MQKILNVIDGVISIPLKAYYTDKVEECVIYRYNTVLNDGVTAQNKLEVRIMTYTIAKAETIQNAINNALINIGDNIKIDNILDIKLNGGGTLYDGSTKMYHYIINYTVKKKVGKI